MKRPLLLLVLLLVLILSCGKVSAYLTAESRISWSFSVQSELVFSISDAELIPTDTGWIVVVTFTPVEGPTSITLSIPGEEEAFTP